MAENRKNELKGQPTEKELAALRQLVLSAEEKGLNLKLVSAESGLGYYRLRRVVKYNHQPTTEEFAAIETAVQELARKRAQDLSQLASV